MSASATTDQVDLWTLPKGERLEEAVVLLVVVVGVEVAIVYKPSYAALELCVMQLLIISARPITPSQWYRNSQQPLLPEHRYRTLRILESVKVKDDSEGAGSSMNVETFQRIEKAWKAVKSMPTGADAGPAPQFVKTVGTCMYVGMYICFQVYM